MISGCSKTGNKNTSSQNTSTQKEKGRYMESSITLPPDIDKNATIQLSKKNGMPYLYSFSGDEQLSVTGFQMNQDGSWIEDTPEWLKSIDLAIGANYQDMVMEDAVGNQYLYYVEITDEVYKASILKSSDGISYDVLIPEGWDEKIPDYNSYYTPERVTVLDDGTLVAYMLGEIKFYNATTMKIEHTITEADYNSISFISYGQNLIIGKSDYSLKLKGIDVYDTKKGYTKTSYPFESKIEGYSFLDVNKNKDIILCNPDGIHVLEESTSIWQTVVDGTLTSLTMQSLWNSGAIAGNDDNYYVLFNSSNGYSLIKYYYDETIDSIPSTELTIYSLKDNATIRQAVALFQQKHPEVRVNFTVAMTTDEYTTSNTAVKEDYIKTLNTELLAGGGTDMLLLDGLPADSYVEKGVLTDMSDVIKPMLDNGDLLTNILNPYIKEGKIYYAPVRFELPLLYGRNEEVKTIDTIDKLADYVNEHNATSFFGNMTQNDFISAFSPFITSRIMMENDAINKEKLIALLADLKVIADNSGIIDQYSEDGFHGNNLWDLASHIKLCLDSVNGFNDSMFSLGIVTYVNGDFVTFENSFIPECEIGINNNSKHKELCKEFISFVFSEEIGKDDFYDGFPVNTKALTLYSQLDRNNYEAYSEIENEDGSYSGIAFRTLNQEQIDTLVNACQSASNRAINDTQINSVFLEETKEFFKGNLSAEDTADRIIEKTSLYLSE